jgi:hypothetical protein
MERKIIDNVDDLYRRYTCLINLSPLTPEETNGLSGGRDN